MLRCSRPKHHELGTAIARVARDQRRRISSLDSVTHDRDTGPGLGVATQDVDLVLDRLLVDRVGGFAIALTRIDVERGERGVLTARSSTAEGGHPRECHEQCAAGGRRPIDGDDGVSDGQLEWLRDRETWRARAGHHRVRGATERTIVPRGSICSAAPEDHDVRVELVRDAGDLGRRFSRREVHRKLVLPGAYSTKCDIELAETPGTMLAVGAEVGAIRWSVDHVKRGPGCATEVESRSSGHIGCGSQVRRHQDGS